MSRSHRHPGQTFALILLLAGFWSGSAWVQQKVDREMAPFRDPETVLWIPSGQVIRILSLGHQGLLADIYWTRAVQYYGSRLRDHKQGYPLLAQLLDITVTLDPQLLVAYDFGALFLSSPPPQGVGDPNKAVDLLQRGIAANPDQWRLWHQLGFIYYWELRDYTKASEAYEEGAKNPDARPWMKVMAAAIHEKGGNRETLLFLWKRTYDGTQDPAIRKNALGHIQGLQAQIDMEEIEKRAQVFRDRTGRWPESIRELVSSGLLVTIPMDSAGYPYRLLPGGKAALDPNTSVTLQYDKAPAPPSSPAP